MYHIGRFIESPCFYNDDYMIQYTTIIQEYRRRKRKAQVIRFSCFVECIKEQTKNNTEKRWSNDNEEFDFISHICEN